MGIVNQVIRDLSINKKRKMNQSQMESAQSQVNEVVGVMRNNIDKVLERDSKLNDLDYRASNLEASSSMFQQSSRRLKKKYWWQNLKMKLWLGGCGIVILITIICIIYFSVPHGGETSLALIQPHKLQLLTGIRTCYYKEGNILLGS